MNYYNTIETPTLSRINIARDSWIDPAGLDAPKGASLIEGPLAEYEQTLRAYQFFLAECDTGHRRQADALAEWRVQVGERIRQGQSATAIWETLGEPNPMHNAYARQLASIARDIALNKQAVLENALQVHYQALADKAKGGRS